MTVSHPPALADLTLTDTPLDGPAPPDRRGGDRLPPAPAARAEVHRAGVASGPDYADELVDVSEGGMKIKFSLAVRPGERFDVTLWGPRGEWCGRYLAVARWAVRTGPAAALAGLRLGRPLPRRAVRAITTPRGLPDRPLPPAGSVG